MKLRNFVYSALEEGELNELNSFMANHRIYNMQKELIKSSDGVYWTILVQYEERGDKKHVQGSEKIDYKAVLSEKEFTLFSKLREKRKELGTEGIPLYAIATNEQLAEMAKTLPKNKTDILKIASFGEGKYSKYGDEFLKVILETTSV